MNKAKILIGSFVALPLIAFAFSSADLSPIFSNAAFAGYGQEKVKLCHNKNTIEVKPSAVPAHLAHGDALGECRKEKDRKDNENRNQERDRDNGENRNR